MTPRVAVAAVVFDDHAGDLTDGFSTQGYAISAAAVSMSLRWLITNVRGIGNSWIVANLAKRALSRSISVTSGRGTAKR